MLKTVFLFDLFDCSIYKKRVFLKFVYKLYENKIMYETIKYLPIELVHVFLSVQCKNI